MTLPRADARWMRLALTLACRGSGQTWPNPSVGCAIVRDGRLVGRGWTKPGGRPHAEQEALAEAGEAAQGATAYVTLEPCAHYGQTPPCAKLLAEAGIARVVLAVSDPFRTEAGSGRGMLERSGVSVDAGCLEREARRANAGYFLRLRQGRPAVTLKLAMTFDGRIAEASGASKWITGESARKAVHAMRVRHDAVMVGCGTAESDDPLLTPRGMGKVRRPVRIVLDSGISISPQSNLGRTAREAPVWIVHADSADSGAARHWKDTGAETISCKGSESGIDVTDALSKLAERGLNSVLCEGGSGIAASLLKHDLVDQLAGFTAGRILGADGIPSVGACAIRGLGREPRFRLERVERFGNDALHLWRRELPH